MKIVSIFSIHEDFIELQYNSILKHVKCDYEYVILNNAPNNVQSQLNEDMCTKLGVKCIKINSNNHHNPSNIAGGALNQMLDIFKGETIFKIDSDMFFISEIDLNSMLNCNDILYIPVFSGNPLKEWVWSGVFGLNTNIINKPINCQPSNGFDTFGESRFLLENPNNKTKKINLFGLQSFEGETMVTSYNNDCVAKFNGSGETVSVERENYLSLYNLKNINYYEKYKDIEKNYMVEYGFPEQYLIDIITIDNIDTIIHFKSASWEGYTEEYTNNKKTALKRLLNR